MDFLNKDDFFVLLRVSKKVNLLVKKGLVENKLRKNDLNKFQRKSFWLHYVKEYQNNYVIRHTKI